LFVLPTVNQSKQWVRRGSLHLTHVANKLHFCVLSVV